MLTCVLKCKNNIESINTKVLKTINDRTTYHKNKLYAAVKSQDL